jgi:hypothetical protein
MESNVFAPLEKNMSGPIMKNVPTLLSMTSTWLNRKKKKRKKRGGGGRVNWVDEPMVSAMVPLSLEVHEEHVRATRRR